MLDEEPSLLGDPVEGDVVADFATPLDELGAQGGERPVACGSDRAGRDAAVAGTGVDPLADLGGAGLAQVQADPAEPGAGGGVLGEELGPLPAVPVGEGQLVHEELGVLHLVGRGELD